jgi:hypothetical protein
LRLNLGVNRYSAMTAQRLMNSIARFVGAKDDES